MSASINTYATDYDDILPLAQWTSALAPYATVNSALLRCPSLPEGSFGYAYNVALPGQSVHSISDPDATPAFFDSIVTTVDVVSSYDAAAPERHGGRNTVYLSGRLDPTDLGGGALPPPPEVRNVCVSRLRVVGSAFSIYASDYDDKLPPADWTDSLLPYSSVDSAIFRCPAVTATGSYGYAMNQSLLGVTTTSIDSPSTVPLVFDSVILTRNATSTYALTNSRHGGGNLAYADGHAGEGP